MYTAQDRVLLEQVQRIWAAFDTDRNGVLDREEMQQFVKAMLENTGGVQQEEMTDEKFNKVFHQFDINGDG